MKKLLIFVILLSFISCSKDFSPLTTKYFNPQKLPLLKLENLDNFWQGNAITHKSSVSGIFSMTSGFMDGLRYSSKGRGVIAVSVFKSQEDAIKIMKERIDNVAAIIYDGDSNDKIKDIWWYSLSSAIFINHNNTIIEASGINNEYEKAKDLLTETTLEISNRIERLSE